MNHLTWQVLQSTIEHLTNKKKFLIAYSGGLDSQVLLYLLVQWATQDSSIGLRAIHINHGLSPNADAWVSFCQACAKHYHIPLLTDKIVIQKFSKEGIEAQARRLRYETIGRYLLKDEVLLTAHHQNDQAETMILQWLRGAGPKGLSAMPNVQSFNGTQMIRPLLSSSKQILRNIADLYHLKWIEDESNECLQFTRNYVREKIMPPLLATPLGSLNNLTRSANHCAEAVQLLSELADMDLAAIPHNQQSLAIPELLLLNDARQRNVLRRWLALAHVLMPSTAQLDVLQREILNAKKSAQPELRLGNLFIRRYQSRLYIVPQTDIVDPKHEWIWNMATVFNLPQRLGTLKAKATSDGDGISIQMLGSEKVTIRFRRGGERMHPSTRHCATSLKHLFQEWQIPPWQRNCWPLIFFNERLIAVVDKAIDRTVVSGIHETGLQIIWQP